MLARQTRFCAALRFVNRPNERTTRHRIVAEIAD
jgi:hypothetical protein